VSEGDTALAELLKPPLGLLVLLLLIRLGS
jgi:hypothetical protein